VRASRIAAPVLERYEAGDYRAAAQLGLRAIEEGGDTPELRYAVANSLAWTGRYDAALEQYRALLGTAYDSRASIGIANIRLWTGEPWLAEERYREVLAGERRRTPRDAARGTRAAPGARPAPRAHRGQPELHSQ
jgi:tetratricopeptide (TPR) repeat protein